MERLQKYLAECGIASRRKSEILIVNGHITVNGKVVNKLGFKINPDIDIVLYDGKIVNRVNKNIYIMLNKPKGYITTTHDQFNRPSVLDLIDTKMRIFPIGRLDYNTTGLLLLTNDGELTFKLTHPKQNIPKTYIAELFGVPDFTDLNRFKNGLIIDGRKTAKAEIEILKIEDNKSNVKIIIHEGRNRQIRKMCKEIKHPVINLRRVKIGELDLDGLGIGKYRYLNDSEIEYLKNL